MPLGWEGIVGSVGIIGVLAAPGVMIDRWVSSGSGPRLAAASAPRRVAVVDSLSGSEALSYDSAHDVYLVSNINGTPQVKDGNGFISRSAPTESWILCTSSRAAATVWCSTGPWGLGFAAIRSGLSTSTRDGMPAPKQHTGVMPPMGGAQLTPAQLAAVAAYIYSLSHSAAG